MPVRLQLEDGTVREYPVVNPSKGIFSSVTRCGARDCSHPECAVELARNLKEKLQFLMWGMAALSVLMALASLLIFLVNYSISGGVRLFDLLVVVGGGLLFLVLFLSTREQLEGHGTALRELEEYLRSRMVNGMPARQVD